MEKINEKLKENFIRINSYGAKLHIVNIDSIAHVKFPDGKAVVTLKTIDENGRNIVIEDAIRSQESYTKLLTTE
ncbi:MAG: hypothetical protein MUC49_22900 [Raineya sp.]|jgi:hypothetical protein|nr:hypothetical protein [Raineya sp.]